MRVTVVDMVRETKDIRFKLHTRVPSWTLNELCAWCEGHIELSPVGVVARDGDDIMVFHESCWDEHNDSSEEHMQV